MSQSVWGRRRGSSRESRARGTDRRHHSPSIRQSIITAASSAPIFTPSSGRLARDSFLFVSTSASPSSRLRPPSWAVGTPPSSYQSQQGALEFAASLSTSTDDRLTEGEGLSSAYRHYAPRKIPEIEVKLHVLAGSPYTL